ncbi:MAG: PKD domain-containing protein [Thermoplasmata archaeon]|nr:PKD domain-containing protein [Thermoplasmata archaeon]
MVYDASDGYVVMFGGGNRTAEFTDTWKFSAGVWTPLMPPSSPSVRSWPAMVYDAKDGYVLLFGGVYGGNDFSDTWKFSQGVWTELFPPLSPPPRWDAALAYDEKQSVVVMFGGDNLSGALGDTWTFTGGLWTRQHPTSSPSPRWGSSMSYDVADGYGVLFGGENGSFCFGDTWTFATGVWTHLSTATSPSARTSFSLAYDPAGAELVLFGGINLTASNDFWDSWSFAGGGWTRLTGATPTARTDGVLVWDSPEAYLLLFDGFNDSFSVNKPTDSQWALAAPLGAGISAIPDPTDVGLPVKLNPNVSGGVGPDTFGWTFGDGGTSLLPSPGHAFSLPGRYTVNLTVVDSFGITSTASLTIVVHPAAAVQASAAPAPLDVTQATSFVTQLSGGTPPFAFRWTFGDGVAATTQNVSHSFASAGNFTAIVNVTDAAGAVASASTHIQVNPLPAVSVTSSDRSPSTSQSVTLAVTVTGGTQPYSITWNLGDGSSASGATATHSYRSKGNYDVQVTVDDGAGASSVAHLNITVSEPATAGIFGLSGLLGYVLLGVLVVAVVVGLALLIQRRSRGRTNAPGPSTPAPPDGVAAPPFQR